MLRNKGELRGSDTPDRVEVLVPLVLEGRQHLLYVTIGNGRRVVDNGDLQHHTLPAYLGEKICASAPVGGGFADALQHGGLTAGRVSMTTATHRPGTALTAISASELSPCADPWVLARSSRAIRRSLQFTPGERCEACHIGENKFGRSARARPKPQKKSGDEPLRDYTAAAADPRSIPGARPYSGTRRSKSASTRGSWPAPACSSNSSIERARTA